LKPLNIFYAEPDPDRWFKFDRYPRRLIRRLVRGKERPGGVMMIAINLMKGLDRIGYPYRFNDYKYIKKHPQEIACIIGKPHVFFDRKWENPVIFGAGIYSHPVEYPSLFELYPNVKRFLVPGEWMREMCAPYYGDKVLAWPMGIDVEDWRLENKKVEFDFVIYDKLNREREILLAEVLNPIKAILEKKKLTYVSIRYGTYTHLSLKHELKRSRATIFLSESETQGAAYQQILSTNTPILAWDRGGYWQDPAYYPDKVKYEPVSSAPYWDDRCGLKFKDARDFEEKLNLFINQLDNFHPRDYILENLTLEKCAEKYLSIVRDVELEIQ
jgi:hypothetical protein